jgi:diaminopimelate decarboxylase
MAKRPKPISPSQQHYLNEYEKYKDVVIEPGRYVNKKRTTAVYEVLSVGLDEVVIKTLKSGHVTTKTLHWCRKNLMEIN